MPACDSPILNNDSPILNRPGACEDPLIGRFYYLKHPQIVLRIVRFVFLPEEGLGYGLVVLFL